MGYRKDVLKGVSWIGSLRVITKLLGFFEILILAKILLPIQFGEYAVALLVLGLLETLTETGVNTILIQEEKIEKYLSSAWVISIIRGCLIAIVIIISAPLIANFFHSVGSQKLLLLVSVVPFLRGFINPAVVKFQKNLEFGKNFSYQSGVLIVDTIVSIFLTYITKHPAGIIGGLIAGVILELAISFILIKPRPSFGYRKDYAYMIFHRGKWITGIAIFDYIFHNLDNLVVGRLLGPSLLGVYQLGYSIAVSPVEEIGKVFVHIGVPILVKLRSDRQRLIRAYFRLAMGTIVLAVPAVIFILIFPHFFVYILGQKWNQLLFILPILAAVGFIKTLNNTSSLIFLSDRRQKYSAVATFVNVVLLALLIVPFVNTGGIFGAGLAAFTSSLATIPFIILLVRRVIKDSNQSHPPEQH